MSGPYRRAAQDLPDGARVGQQHSKLIQAGVEQRTPPLVGLSMEEEELIRHMRARVEQCRRLAKYINDPRTTEALLQMAAEGEADIRKLETREGQTVEPDQLKPR